MPVGHFTIYTSSEPWHEDFNFRSVLLGIEGCHRNAVIPRSLITAIL